MLNLNTKSFKDYDIRGIYPTEINEEFFYHLGKAVAQYIKTGPVGVGYDTRLSSPALFKSLVNGITDYGVDVISLGNISTEIHNFASGKYGFELNVIVTASHNPAEYNGAKFAKKGAVPIYSGYGLPDIKAFVNQEIPKVEHKGFLTEKNIFDEWINHALSYITVNSLKKLKVIVDAGNGMGGPSWTEMQKRLPVEIVGLYVNPDGNFPHHLPDPLKDENTLDLQKKIQREGADIGIALDGDADRAFFMDETGTKLSGTVTTAIITDYLIRKTPGKYGYNAICGRVVRETIERHGGTPVRTRVGHSFIKNVMRGENVEFVGEHSGHFFYKSNYYAESSLITGLLMLQILSESGKKLSDLRKQYDIYPVSGEINFKADDKQKIIAAIKESYGKKTESTDELDGITFWYKDWWFNVRMSSTEPLLRLNAEADSQSILDQQVQGIIDLITANGGEFHK